MSYPVDDFARIRELIERGESECAVERYTGISRTVIRNALGRNKNGSRALVNDELSTRQRQRLLNWKSVCPT